MEEAASSSSDLLVPEGRSLRFLELAEVSARRFGFDLEGPGVRVSCEP